MGTTQKNVFIVAGEASGDMHAAHLVEILKKLDPELHFSGLGGKKMKEAGVELFDDLTRFAVVGFTEVLKHYGSFKKIFDAFLAKVRAAKPDAVILVDYPGFNLRLAKELKKLNTKVIYYISPQVWAWKENRVSLIKSSVDRMIVLFPFEKEFYARHGLDVFWSGHPLMDEKKILRTKEKFLESLGLSDYKLTIALLPGSREGEVKRHLPVMIKTAELLNREFPMIQYLLVKAPTINDQLIKKYLPENFQQIKIVDGNSYDGLNAANLAVVASGTATLETALLEKPMVVIYKTSFLTWLLARSFIKIPYIGLVNVVAGEKIVPECIQFDATPLRIAEELKNIFTNEPRLANIKDALKKVKDSLGPPGASERAAKEVLKVIS